jgi:hypothetical protein
LQLPFIDGLSEKAVEKCRFEYGSPAPVMDAENGGDPGCHFIGTEL